MRTDRNFPGLDRSKAAGRLPEGAGAIAPRSLLGLGPAHDSIRLVAGVNVERATPSGSPHFASAGQTVPGDRPVRNPRLRTMGNTRQ